MIAVYWIPWHVNPPILDSEEKNSNWPLVTFIPVHRPNIVWFPGSEQFDRIQLQCRLERFNWFDNFVIHLPRARDSGEPRQRRQIRNRCNTSDCTGLFRIPLDICGRATVRFAFSGLVWWVWLRIELLQVWTEPKSTCKYPNGPKTPTHPKFCVDYSFDIRFDETQWNREWETRTGPINQTSKRRDSDSPGRTKHKPELRSVFWIRFELFSPTCQRSCPPTNYTRTCLLPPF